MQIVVLGAAGSLGRAASRAVAALDEIDGVTLADIDGPAIDALAGELGPTAEAIEVDATDGDRLAELLADHDAVINAIGPYDRFSAPVLDAAIQHLQELIAADPRPVPEAPAHPDKSRK